MRGVLEDLGTPAQVRSVVAALAAKYARAEDQQYLPSGDPALDVVYALRARRARDSTDPRQAPSAWRTVVRLTFMMVG